MPSLIYNSAKATMNLANWSSYDVRAMLVGPAYTPDPDHVTVSQVAGELTNGSYARKSITGRFGTVDTVHDLVSYSANNPTWVALSGGEAIRHVIFFKQVTNDSDSQLLFCLALPASTAAGDNFVIQFNGGVTSGIVFELKATADPLQGPQGIPGPPGADGGVTLPLDVEDIDAVGIPNGYVIRAINNLAEWGPVPVAFEITGFALSGPSLVEVGQGVVNPAFVASYSDGTLQTAVLTNNANGETKDVHSTPNSFASSQTYVKSVPNQSVDFTDTAQGAIGPAVARVATLTWGQLNFWGVSSSPAATAAFINSLANSQLSTTRFVSFSVNASGTNKIYVAVPTRYGTPVFTVNGFGGGFILYATVSRTNSHGYTENYNIYESVLPGLGLTTGTAS
jgi:hypothetical protein